MHQLTTLILIIFMAFAKVAIAQTSEDKMKMALNFQSQKEYEKSNRELIDLYSTNYMKELVTINLAKNYYALGNERLCDKYVSECIAMNGNYFSEAVSIKSLIFFSCNRYAEAESLLKQAYEKNPNSYQIGCLLCKTYIELNRSKSLINKQLLTTMQIDFYNPRIHQLFSYNCANRYREYTQAFLGFCYLIFFNKNNRENLYLLDNVLRKRDIKDALQEVLYDSDTTISVTAQSVNWAMSFMQDIPRCNHKFSFVAVKDSQLLSDFDSEHIECIKANTKNLLKKLCESVTVATDKNEWSMCDFYIDFFQKLLNDNMLDEYLYISFKSVFSEDSDYYFYGMTEARLEKFAVWLENNLQQN